MIMPDTTARCGLDCSSCPAYLSMQNNDQDLRQKTAIQWSKEYAADIKADSINCTGCRSASGPLFSHCQVCEFRKCATARNLETCAECPDYACEGLSTFFTHVPEAKVRLDTRRSS